METLAWVVAVLAILTAIGLFVASRLPRWLAGVPIVPSAELKARIADDDDILVVDVREPSEFEAPPGHIPGSVNLPLTELGTRLRGKRDALGDLKETTVYVVCSGINRASLATRTLRDAGFQKIRLVEGGVTAWQKDGNPMELQGPADPPDPKETTALS